MNRTGYLYLLLLLAMFSCDNASNVKPASENYFLKFYGQTGYQEGVDVKQTADGGFIIGGNSIATFEGSSDYLLIKIDAQGNQEWQMTYDFGGDDRLTEVVVANNEYVIAGTSAINGYNKILLFKVDSDGNELGNFVVEEAETFNYTCTGLTYSSSNEFLVVGSLDSPVGVSLNGNSILIIVSNDLSIGVPKYSGIDNEKLTFIKAFEVLNQQTQLPNYLAFGYKEDATTGDIEMGVAQYDNLLEPIDLSQYKNASNAKTVDVIDLGNDQFMILGASDNLSVLMQADKDVNQKYFVGGGNVIFPPNNSIIANGVSQIGTGQFVVSGDILIQNSTTTKAAVFRTNSNGSVDWLNEFGTTSSYKSGKVRILSDGSIAFTGTAGLESQTKVFLVKMKSTGQMK